MATNKTCRWLAVASRAASFRTLLQSADVAQSKRAAQASQTALMDGREQTHRAHAAWRAHATAANFHVAGDALHRRFHGQLSRAEAHLTSAAESDRHMLAQAEDGLRIELARRDGLQRSLERTTRRLRDEHNRRTLKDADDIWNVLRNSRVNDEDS